VGYICIHKMAIINIQFHCFGTFYFKKSLHEEWVLLLVQEYDFLAFL